jgi:uncharacterized membrane protein
MKSNNRLEFFVSILLRIGVVISGLMMVFGLVLFWLTGDASCPTGLLTLDWIIWGDPFLMPSHVIFLGFLILVMTPILPVATSILVNLRSEDWLFTVITSTVLIILIFSMSLGIG